MVWLQTAKNFPETVRDSMTEPTPDFDKNEMLARHAYLHRKGGFTTAMILSLVLRDHSREQLSMIMDGLHTQVEGMKGSGASHRDIDLATTTMLALKARIETMDDQRQAALERKLVDGAVVFDPKAPVGSPEYHAMTTDQPQTEYEMLRRMMDEVQRAETDQGTPTDLWAKHHRPNDGSGKVG